MAGSYRSPKTRVRASPIHGRGLFAVRPIRRGEVVAVKGGHILDRRALARTPARDAESHIQIEDDLYIGAITPGEVPRNKLFINHSCEPNVGIRGQITFVALRDVAAGEELTYDWAMEEDRATRTRCTCRAPSCRGILTGQDWRLLALQRQYRGFFSAYLATKIAASAPVRRRGVPP
jgi:SET domain-containing protein